MKNATQQSPRQTRGVGSIGPDSVQTVTLPLVAGIAAFTSNAIYYAKLKIVPCEAKLAADQMSGDMSHRETVKFLKREIKRGHYKNDETLQVLVVGQSDSGYQIAMKDDVGVATFWAPRAFVELKDKVNDHVSASLAITIVDRAADTFWHSSK